MECGSCSFLRYCLILSCLAHETKCSRDLAFLFSIPHQHKPLLALFFATTLEVGSSGIALTLCLPCCGVVLFQDVQMLESSLQEQRFRVSELKLQLEALGNTGNETAQLQASLAELQEARRHSTTIGLMNCRSASCSSSINFISSLLSFVALPTPGARDFYAQLKVSRSRLQAVYCFAHCTGPAASPVYLLCVAEAPCICK